MIEGIIFDMDGVLVNTEPLHALSYIEVLAHHKISLTEAQYYEHWTRQGKGIREFVSERAIPINSEKLREEKRRIYHAKLVLNLPVIPSAVETIQKLSRNYLLALATSSYRPDVDLILFLLNLSQEFDKVVTANDVKNEKPNPECFLVAASKLRIHPSRLLVIEDSEKGLVAANRAGIKAIAIPNKFTCKGNDFSLAYRIISEISVLTPEYITSI